ncbi:Vgb family protein [Alteromonas sp. CYL-A6]|uniref:Vgb family protein n=1 Tax=Alteromonas nitratireducens TaxID=3390813 RepID=UPI0034AC5C44
MRRALFIVVFIITFNIYAAVTSDNKVSADAGLTSWQVPWENTRPRDPMLDSKGNVWFCGQQGNYIARLNPTTGEFTRFTLPDASHPHNLIIDTRDTVWYSGNRNGHIGALNPHTGEITQYPLPKSQAGDPHTLVFDSKGNIWFTVQWGNIIGYLDTASGEFTLYDVPIERARPYGIKVDKNDTLWIVLLGTNHLATIKNKTLALITIPDETARPRRLEIDKQGDIWYADYAGGKLGFYSPASGEFSSWTLPTGSKSFPYATALDGDGHIWLSDTSAIPNKLIMFNPVSRVFEAVLDVPFGGHIRHTYYAPESGEIWFGTDTGYIGKLSVN